LYIMMGTLNKIRGPISWREDLQVNN
jgi:hypothetical protein